MTYFRICPGFGGQSFIPATLERLRQARKLIDESGYDIRLEIDGGVKVSNIREIAETGADTFVAGPAIFNAAKDCDPNRYDSIVKDMRDESARLILKNQKVSSFLVLLLVSLKMGD